MAKPDSEPTDQTRASSLRAHKAALAAGTTALGTGVFLSHEPGSTVGKPIIEYQGDIPYQACKELGKAFVTYKWIAHSVEPPVVLKGGDRAELSGSIAASELPAGEDSPDCSRYSCRNNRCTGREDRCICNPFGKRYGCVPLVFPGARGPAPDPDSSR